MHDVVLARSDEPGPPVALVVGVRSREHHRVSAAPREGSERVVQLGLAVVAAVAAVRPVSRTCELVRPDDLVGDADRVSDGARTGQLARRERRRHRGDGERARTERARRERCDERGVDASRERDDRAVERRGAVARAGR